MLYLINPCKITGSRSRKYLWNRLFIAVWNFVIVIKEITAHIFPVAVPCLFCPCVIFRGMIHHKIAADIYFSFMACPRQILQVPHCPHFWGNLTEIADCVTSVRLSLCRLQKRHQMNTIHITLLQIIQFLPDTLHIFCKIINIEHHAKQIVLLIPVGILFSETVEFFQLLPPFHIKDPALPLQFPKHICIVIKLHIQPTHLFPVFLKPLLKNMLRSHFLSFLF